MAVGGACVAGGSVHAQGACMARGVHGRGHVWQGACGRGHAWQERWSLQWTVRILLECILVENLFIFFAKPLLINEIRHCYILIFSTYYLYHLFTIYT